LIVLVDRAKSVGSGRFAEKVESGGNVPSAEKVGSERRGQLAEIVVSVAGRRGRSVNGGNEEPKAKARASVIVSGGRFSESVRRVAASVAKGVALRGRGMKSGSLVRGAMKVSSGKVVVRPVGKARAREESPAANRSSAGSRRLAGRSTVRDRRRSLVRVRAERERKVVNAVNVRSVRGVKVKVASVRFVRGVRAKAENGHFVRGVKEGAKDLGRGRRSGFVLGLRVRAENVRSVPGAKVASAHFAPDARAIAKEPKDGARDRFAEGMKVSARVLRSGRFVQRRAESVRVRVVSGERAADQVASRRLEENRSLVRSAELVGEL